MSLEHHGDNLRGESEVIKRFRDQLQGKALRKWPEGRLGACDDGELSYAIAADPKSGVIKIDFGKPVTWIGLSLDAANQLRDILSEKILELRGIKA